MFVSFVIIVSSISYILSTAQISDVENEVVENHRIIGSFLSKEIEVGYFESKWPFEGLKKLSEQKDFLFWWIVREDGAIHLADNISFMGTLAQDYFPHIDRTSGEETISLDRRQNHAIFFKSFTAGKKKWSFWFGFSLNEISERRKEIIFLITTVCGTALILLGIILYLAIKHFTEPVKELTAGAAIIGRGDLDYRVKVDSKDELGLLADTFNKMTEDLKKTVVSKDYVDNIIENMLDALVVINPDGKIGTVNKGTCDLLGYKPEELISNTFDVVFDAEEIRQKGGELERLIREDNLRNYEIYLKTKDGKKVPVLLSGSQVRNSEGKMTSVVYTGRDITERKRTEDALLKAAQQWRTTFDGISDMVCLLDPEGRILKCNKAMANLLGKPFSEIVSRTHPEIMHWDQSSIKECFIERMWKTRRKETGILPMNDRWFNIAVDPLLDETGCLIGAVHIMSDITDQKKSEDALRRSEESARQIAKENEIMAGIGRIISSTLNIEEVYEPFSEQVRKLIPFDRIVINIINIEKDTVANVYMAGKGIADRKVGEIYPLTGSGNAEMVRTKSMLLIQTEDFNEYKDRFPMLLSTFQAGFRSIMNVPLFSKGQIVGGLLLRSLKPYAYTDKDVRLAERIGDQIAGAIANAQLFIERKRAGEALRQSEEKYRTILENIQDGYLEVDLAGNFTFVNDAESRNLGHTSEELMGMNYRQYTDETTARKLYQAFNGVYRTGESIKVLDVEVIRKDGTKALNEISVSLIRDSVGKPIGFRGVARDVTERKRAEEERLALQEQLRQSQKMQAIGQLAGGVAHDFNNLLTVIAGYTDLILRKLTFNDPMREHAEDIKKATEKAASLTRQLLAFGRKQILQPKVLNLNDVVTNLSKMLRRLIGEDIQLVTVLAEDLGKVKADPGQIEQVVLNLAVNARDAMPSGGKLTIETANAELDENFSQTHFDVNPGRYLMLSVSDTGIGMTPEVRERIFEPFFTTKEKGKGTGLGLSTVYGIVKQSDGNIWVYSEPRKGTTFKIYLPRIEEDAESLRPSMRTTKPLQGSETVLLVEDEEMVRRLARRILQASGYRLLEASNGEEAFRLVQEQKGKPIHLMVTDVVMPGMNGRELADCLESLKPEMRVLYMSGYTDDAIVRHGILQKKVNYIQKPFTYEEFASKVREVLDV